MQNRNKRKYELHTNIDTNNGGFKQKTQVTTKKEAIAYEQELNRPGQKENIKAKTIYRKKKDR